MGTCLSVKTSPSNGRIHLLIKNLLPISKRFFDICFETATHQRLSTRYNIFGPEDEGCTFARNVGKEFLFFFFLVSYLHIIEGKNIEQNICLVSEAEAYSWQN
jgi:hypothetical protein